MSAALLLSLAIFAEAPLHIAVLPVEGNAPEDLRAAVAEALTQSLRGINGLEVIGLAVLEPTLGPRAAEYEACPDDRCRLAQLGALRLDRLLLVRFETTPLNRLELRLVDTGTISAPTLSRIRVELTEAQGAPARAAEAALELFPEQVARSLARLVVVAPVGAGIWFDDEPLGFAPVAPIAAKPGPHRLTVRLPRHRRSEQTLTLALGREVRVEVELERVRGDWPLVLGASALGTAAVGLALGLNASGIADNWNAACAESPCRPGFDRQRYLDDRRELNLERNLANGFFVAAGSLAVAAVVTYFLDPGVAEEP